MTEQTIPSPAPAAPMLESDARTMAMAINVIAIAGAVLSGGFLGVLAVLVVWLIYRERSALVDHHGKQQLNLAISLTVATAITIVGSIATLGLGAIVLVPLMIAYGIYSIVVSILAAIAAQRGEYYRMSIVWQLVR
jgi:uncharacterized Tic20 family protein